MASAGDTARKVFGYIGNATTALIYAAPVYRSRFVDIKTNGSVQQYSPDPYLAALLNCMVWLLYALPFVHPDSMPVLTINIIGVIVEAIYVTLFIYYSAGAVRRRVLVLLTTEVVVTAFVAALVLGLAQSYERRSLWFGVLGVFSGIGMYASPLSSMIQVFRTRSVEHISLPLSVASLVNAVVWTIYSLIGAVDLYVFIPNMVGVLCAGAQLVVYTYFSYNGGNDVLA